MKTLIVGAGALGILFAGIMSSHGGDVEILTRRTEAAEAISSEGVVVEEESSTIRAWPECSTDPSTALDADVCIICVKSYDTGPVAEMILPYLPESCLVVTVQNGLNNVKKLAEILGPERIIGGCTMQASTLTGLNRVFHAYNGETVLGGHPATTTQKNQIKRVAEELTRLGLKTSVTDNVYPQIVTKLIVNSVINPLTALLRLRNGEILKIPVLGELVNELVDEGVEAGRVLGVRLSSVELKKVVHEAIISTSENKSSMLQDIERGRKTEIEFINGAIARILRDEGKAAPLNTILTQLVLAIEQGRQALERK
ncbi:MAG: 2-dehydropantoate 2-reductase [Nitrososphaerota archaeon]|nr:2-dehydropantoate 2-reductase [Candidatus Calditenuaceae archaeon]MDW8073006.1 2-dehydropantoate 2-reductase [Nitrososphaerota archaeon]